jgi:heme exporter protein A
VDAGSSLLVVGANGSGKTTLLRALATSLRPSAGTIAWSGAAAAARARPFTALLTHRDGLYDDLSAGENLALVAALLGRGVDEATELARVGLSGVASGLVGTFSAGMRKRLALARVLVQEPRLVLLDEPFAALDAEGAALVERTVAGWRERGVTVVIASHQVVTASRMCAEAIGLSGGGVAWRGAAADAGAFVGAPSDLAGSS